MSNKLASIAGSPSLAVSSSAKPAIGVRGIAINQPYTTMVQSAPSNERELKEKKTHRYAHMYIYILIPNGLTSARNASTCDVLPVISAMTLL